MNQKLLYNLVIWVVLSLACVGCEQPTPEIGGPVATLPLPTATNTLPSATRPPTPAGLETVTVAQVVDGDTVELTNGRKVRYIGINTPERDQPYYAEAAAVNRQLVEGKNVQLELDVQTFDQYGRTLAYVWVDGVMVNLEIVQQGYANVFTVPPNVRYEDQLRQAEREAREAERGLWAGSSVVLTIMHIQADAPGSDNENPNGEWIEIANQGNEPVLMQGYTLKDEANHIYTFRDFIVGPGTSFRLYTGQGQDNATALYWGFSGESVWNNNSDAAFLRDSQGALVDTFAY